MPTILNLLDAWKFYLETSEMHSQFNNNSTFTAWKLHGCLRNVKEKLDCRISAGL